MPAIYGVACETVRMPGENSVGFTTRDSAEYFVEYWTARDFCAAGFLKDCNDLQVLI